MLERVVNIAVAVSLSALAADLLYLYFVSKWYDPYRWVEYTEVAALFVLGVQGLLWAGFLTWRWLHEPLPDKSS